MQAPKRLLSWLSFAISAPFLLLGQMLPLLARPEAGPVFVPYPEGLRLIAVVEGSLRGMPHVWPFDLPETWNGLPLIPYRDALHMRDRMAAGIEQDLLHLLAMRELGLQAVLRDARLEDEQRRRLQDEFSYRVERVGRVSESTYHGIELFGGGTVVFWRRRSPANQPIYVHLPDLSPTGLGLVGASFDLASASNASYALATLDAAIDSVALRRSELGALSLRLEPAAPRDGLRGTVHHQERLRELAIQATNGTLNSGQRAHLQLFFETEALGIQDVAEAACHAGTRVLDGETDALLEGPPPTHLPIFLHLPDATPTGLGLSSATFDVTTASNASAAIATLDAALDRVAEFRLDLQAARERLLTRPGPGHVAQRPGR